MRSVNTCEVSSVVIVRDLGAPIHEYRADLSDTEWCQVETFTEEKRQRHFIIGRLAARYAIRHVLGSESHESGNLSERRIRNPFSGEPVEEPCENSRENGFLRALPSIEIILETNGAPQVFVDGRPEIVSVSLSHSSRLAAACAWRTIQFVGFSIGVDIERLRASDAATSPYAFSKRERTMLSNLSSEKRDMGIVAWSVKEAVWKAFRPDASCGPDSIEIQNFDWNGGCADVQVRYGLVPKLGKASIQTRFSFIEGPDGEYVSSTAFIIPPDVPAADIDNMIHIRLGVYRR